MLCVFLLVELSVGWCVILPTSPSLVERAVTRDFDHTPVRQHVYPCTPGNLERPLTQKTLCTMFYVEVESAAVSVESVNWSPSSQKIVCV